MTGIGRGVQLIAKDAQHDKFPGGKTVLWSERSGVGVVTKNLNDDEKQSVDTAKDKIIMAILSISDANEIIK